jgi:WD40 repeat protein
MSLLESATLVEQTTPLKSSRLPCDAYVLAIAAFGSFYAASASAPSHRIYLFDKTSLGTSHSFEGHREGTTSLCGVDSVAGTNRRVIVSSGRDGVVRVWDDRTGTTAIESKYVKLCVPNRTGGGGGGRKHFRALKTDL